MSFNETHRRGSSQAAGSMRGPGDTPSQADSQGLPQGRLSLPQQPSKKEQVQGANSRGNLKVRGEPQQAVATADKCHAAEQDAPAEVT